MRKEIIVEANVNDAEEITSLTKISKAFWGYDDEQIKKWEKDLTITKEYIIKNEVYKMTSDDIIKGYYSYIEKEGSVVELDNIFLHPSSIGKGYGSVLMNDFLKKIQESNFEKVRLYAEPKAEKFYIKFGFKTVGKIESSIPNRFLPVMELAIK
ncbi:ribosomal protein S18 acetylase RimI-like enzyme [Aquimarina sp. MAR_2010_214]|uniref:GNAT family N-acetyltransferase n=1 Tax=Aquimarina sp. MAR_2010_214 TaxID=1250026 RepID=UPI000C703D8F|nr:GNAT family N-acetyltransferase [Aquimarina sp. MAR_2010_214]PKV48414.1 ribosomal protein S18 acetylase RimI-like enzyme [Aquimarina sp. MAR_2010_214]